MKLLHRTGHPTPGPELDTRLHEIFDDGRTPGAPESLYGYLREISMESPTGSGRGRLGLLWQGLGRTGRAAASLALIVVVAGGVLAVTMRLSGGMAAETNRIATPGPIPSAPGAPAGWHSVASFGTDGVETGIDLVVPEPRIAIHVACTGPDELVVFVYTQPGIYGPDGVAAQAARFNCYGGQNRVEFTSTGGGFQQIWAAVIRNPSSLVDTIWVVGIEVPDTAPTPSPST
jgi:hypothetical protein